jgi:hypothetical protein
MRDGRFYPAAALNSQVTLRYNRGLTLISTILEDFQQ